MNPLLPPGTFVPDAEARAWSDGRLYLYGSLDIEGNTAYCSCEYKVFSSGDLKQWTDHGVSFRSRGEASGVPWSEMPLYAPDCICVDGKYYLYFCQADNGEGVAVGDAPQGPFADAVPVQGAHGDAIDPAVFFGRRWPGLLLLGPIPRAGRANAGRSGFARRSLRAQPSAERSGARLS
ncbi:family 43 glycosylhydrolase [Cohnella rhizosphaerae]|uniref:Family 43 glycosylhydrolase n=1 Tax=Cohnella rhizosphaerae TaxID=1457232 RepID=A0A9X4QWS3_9BACL|nr:family 43 glycosylhydrolase [Cohnella rhizosphaerae]MDG0813853.1 family 43 glycosylhydrolase [Cohnella rhizosphaerae]